MTNPTQPTDVTALARECAEKINRIAKEQEDHLPDEFIARLIAAAFRPVVEERDRLAKDAAELRTQLGDVKCRHLKLMSDMSHAPAGHSDIPASERAMNQHVISELHAERNQLRAEVERLKVMTQTPAGWTERGEWKPECNSLYVYDAEGKLIGSNHPIAAVAEEYRLRHERTQLRAALDLAEGALKAVAYPNYCGGEQAAMFKVVIERQEIAREALARIEEVTKGMS